MDLLHQCVDCASDLITGMETSHADKSGVGEIIHKLEEATLQKHSVSGGEEITDIRPELRDVERGKGEEKGPEIGRVAKTTPFIPQTPRAIVPAPSPTGTVRISTAKLDLLLLQAEEMLAVKLAAGQRALELKELKSSFARWKKKSFKTAPGRQTQAEAGDKGEAGPLLSSFEAGLTKLIKAAEYDQRSTAVMIDALLDDMKKTVMLPFSSLFESFPRFVRDLAREAGKEVELNIEGGEIEIDRRVLDEMKDPLIHIVRNCVDHGIETPEDRKKKNKPSRGNIEISVSSRDSRIEIAVLRRWGWN